MKKVIFCAVVLLLALNAIVFADRRAIDEVIQAYEDIVIESEVVAQMPLVSSSNFIALDEKAADAGPKILAIENEKEWGIQDVKRLADLNARFNLAMTAIAKKALQY